MKSSTAWIVQTIHQRESVEPSTSALFIVFNFKKAIGLFFKDPFLQALNKSNS